MEKENLKTIHEKDFKAYLKKIKVLDLVENGKAKCKFCDEIITLKNIYSLFPESGQVRFVCEKSACIRQFSLHIREKRYGSN